MATEPKNSDGVVSLGFMKEVREDCVLLGVLESAGLFPGVDNFFTL